MIKAFLANGGRIRKCAEARPTTMVDVLQYLRSRSIGVQRLQSRTGQFSYMSGDRTMSPKDLVSFANGHRRRQRLPPFDLAWRQVD